MAPKKIRTNCERDPDRLSVFQDCFETYGMEERNPGSEWPWNVLARSAVSWTCGLISLPDVQVNHEHEPEEFALCTRLAEEVSTIMADAEVGMGSESSDPFRPYYRVACLGDPVPAVVTESLVRRAFGGTIYPPTKIWIEPLEEQGEWWGQVVQDQEGIEEGLEPWREMIRWFHTRPILHSPMFVMIGDDPLDEDLANGNGGCVFPRLAVALSKQGSLVGLGGWCVHT